MKNPMNDEDYDGNDEQIDDLKELADGLIAADLFFQELLDSVETLTGIADEHGPRTLADLMYLQHAILKNGFIDHYPGESKVLEIARALPSGERWTKFIKVEFLAEIEKGSIEDEIPPGTSGKLVTLDGEEIEGTLENLTGTAIVSSATRNADGSIEMDYEGSTDIDWNTQTTVKRDGEILFVTASCRFVPQSQVKLVKE